MTEFFVKAYGWLSSHKVFTILFQVVTLVIFILLILRLDFRENVTEILPDDAGSQNMVEVFNNLQVSDKFVVMFTSTEEVPDYDALSEAAEEFAEMVWEAAGVAGDADVSSSEGGAGLIREILLNTEDEAVTASSEFIFDILPVYLEEEDYGRIDSLLTVPGAMEEQIAGDRAALVSPAGSFLKSYILRDPLGLATERLTSLSTLSPASGYDVIDGYIYAPDGRTLMCFITPEFGTGETGTNTALVKIVEDAISAVNEQWPGLEADYFAGPAVGVYNSRQVQKDTVMTVIFAIVCIAVLIAFSFRKRLMLLPVVCPVIWGMAFSLAAVSLIKGSISSIAVGAGAIVLGVALSYSIHMVAHQVHVKSIEQLIREMVFPFTVGSLTTIGAFVSLLFTSSSLLRDFGLFASLTLVGTTLYSLFFLPHWLRPMQEEGKTRFMNWLGKVNSYPLERHGWVLILIAVLFVVCIFTSKKVDFNTDMMSLCYMPDHLEKAQEKLMSFAGDDEESILFVSTGSDISDAVGTYKRTNEILDSLIAAGAGVSSYSSAAGFLVPEPVQAERIARWNAFWTEERVEAALLGVDHAAQAQGFKSGTFDALSDMLSKEYAVTDYSGISLLENYVAASPSGVMLVSDASLDPEDKDLIYSAFAGEETVVFDRSYFTGQMVKSMSDDMNMILWISSIIVFIGLCFSYRRLELAVMSFLPMLITWVIIIGLMGLFGIQFNIVSIIICTFVFGIGDDFSIFITDGLITRYASGKEMLASHKTAIFFSTFTIVAGMGAMILAGHPALHSVGTISLLGMLSVVLIAFVFQPFVFDRFVIRPTSKGRHPYNFSGTLVSAVLWAGFLLACVVTILLIVVMLPLPMKKLKKQKIVRKVAYRSARRVLYHAPVCDIQMRNPLGEDFSKPCVMVSNHQSFLDILWVLSLSPKLLIMGRTWVKKVPFFYPIATFLGFYFTDKGYKTITEDFAKRAKDGWSLAVFPEGTRSRDWNMHKFHRGAFFIAEKAGVDVLPVVMYGNGRIFPVGASLNMIKGSNVIEFLPRISTAGTNYRDMTKSVNKLIERRYWELEREFATVDNPYYFSALRRSMIYKGIEAERDTRQILRDKEGLRALDEALPRSGRILHLGCGMGQADYLLKMLAPEREIVGVDADEEKIAIAGRNYLRRSLLITPAGKEPSGLDFVCADPAEYSRIGFDVVIDGTAVVQGSAVPGVTKNA